MKWQKLYTWQWILLKLSWPANYRLKGKTFSRYSLKKSSTEISPEAWFVVSFIWLNILQQQPFHSLS